MPDVCTSIRYLADIDLYQREKPYYIFWSPGEDSRPVATTNIQWEDRDGILIQGMREDKDSFSIDKNGFEIVPHATKIPLPISTAECVATYKQETEEMLRYLFGALTVYCYETRIRSNEPAAPLELDFRNPLLVERPADGPHIDATKDSGPKIIEDHLPEDLKPHLTPKSRVRIVNTWRSMLPVVDDRPLAFMDYRTANKHDLIAADRVMPFAIGEIYYVRFNPEQKWYWLESMTCDEPAVFLTYDSQPAQGAARFCPHVSFANPAASKDAPYRQSIETRSIVISEA